MIKNAVLTSWMLALCAAGQAKADILLNLVNPPDQSGTPYSLSFVAGAATTDILFAGYQAPARLWAEDISLTSGDGNLLGTTWIFTPFHTLDTVDAGQFNDGFGSGTNGLYFANGVGDLDRFDQLVSTVAGRSYTLDFVFINNPDDNGANNAPSELVVSAIAVPEPSTFWLVSLSAGILIIVMRRKHQTQPAGQASR